MSEEPHDVAECGCDLCELRRHALRDEWEKRCRRREGIAIALLPGALHDAAFYDFVNPPVAARKHATKMAIQAADELIDQLDAVRAESEPPRPKGRHRPVAPTPPVPKPCSSECG